MSGHVGVFAQYTEDETWPPEGEVVLKIGPSQRLRFDAENARIVARALLMYADVADVLTKDVVDHPQMAAGLASARSGYLH